MRTISTHDTYTAVVKEAWILLDTLHHEGMIFFSKNILEDISPLCGFIDTPVWTLVTFFLSFKATVDPSLACFVTCMQWIPDSPLV